MQTKRTLIYALYYMLILVQNEVHTYLNVKPKTKSSFKKKENLYGLWLGKDFLDTAQNI